MRVCRLGQEANKIKYFIYKEINDETYKYIIGSNYFYR